MNGNNSVLFSYFLYFDDREIHIGYGTQAASLKSLGRGRRVGNGRFAMREEAEAARAKWREKFHLTSTVEIRSALVG